MIDLTEQWKKGELPNNWYYVRTTNGIEKWEYIKQSHGFGYYETEWVLEVLAPVPTYEELQNINKSVNDLMASNIKLVEENTQLKELLKEVLRHELSLKEISELTRKICQALGEE